MLQENAKIKKIYRGTLTSVYIYTKKLFSIINNIFYLNLRFISDFSLIKGI